MAEIDIMSVINKLRPRPERKGTLTIEDIGKELAKVSGMDTGDVHNFIYKLSDIITDSVNQGYHVNMGRLGVFGVSCDLDGNTKPTHRASFEFRKAVRTGYEGDFKNPANKGLDDKGFARKWLEDHPKDTVVMRDGSIRTKDDYGL